MNYIGVLFLFFVCVLTHVTHTMPTLAEAKAARKVSKAKVTRLCNKVSQFIAEDANLAEIPSLVSQVKQAFSEFTASHEQVVNLDTDENADHDGYFEQVQTNYIKVLSRAKSIKSVPAQESKSTLVPGPEVFNLLSLPKVELEVFKGDPLQYHTFIKAFQLSVEKCCADPDAKLTRLLQYTAGDAKEAIRSSIFLGGERGYKHALETLQNLYGSPHRVTQDIIKTLRSSKPVKSASDMRTLSHELRNSFQVLQNINCLGEVDSQVVIFDIIARLPNFAQNRWYKEELKHKRTSGAYLKFKNLVEFVEMISDEMNDPLCGNAARADRFHQRKQVTSHNAQTQQSAHTDHSDEFTSAHVPGTNFEINGSTHEQRASRSTRTPPPCKLCTEPHFIMRCPQFRGMKVRDRIAFVKVHQLCNNCLRDNHQTSECTSKSRCFVCEGKHTSFLHTDQASANFATDANNCLMPIVRVQVNGSIWVNAALDTFSSSSFCTERLANQLHLKGTNQHYILKTMSGTTPTVSKQVSFEVASGHESMVLSGVKVIPQIPASTGTIDPNEYSHLRGIDLSACINCQEVDILIGQDFSDALIPLEVRSGLPGQPHAVRYKFGWTVSGTIPDTDVSNVVICNLLSACPIDVKSNLSAPAADMNKLQELKNGAFDRPGLSVLDKKVIDLWDDNSKMVNGSHELPIPCKNPEEDLPNNFTLAQKRKSWHVCLPNMRNLLVIFWLLHLSVWILIPTSLDPIMRKDFTFYSKNTPRQYSATRLILGSGPSNLTPLNPNSLLTLRQFADFPPGGSSASGAFRSCWKYVQHLANLFLSRWVKEYIPTLNARSKWRVESCNIKVGELVLVHDSGLPRNLWPLAIVQQVFPGDDGKVRSVLVKTRVTQLHRPITQLVRLEADG